MPFPGRSILLAAAIAGAALGAGALDDDGHESAQEIFDDDLARQGLGGLQDVRSVERVDAERPSFAPRDDRRRRSLARRRARATARALEQAFCAKGEGGRFVADGGLVAHTGKLAVNTDGGGLCNNHPANRGGITKVIEAVRQLRGEAHPKVQVPNCTLALAQGTGGLLGSRHGSATLIMERQ